MVGALLTTTPLNAQERVAPGEPFLADSSGWYFTDAMVEDMARDAEEVMLLERQKALWDDLVALKDQKIQVLEEELDDQKPTFWEAIPPVIWFVSGVILWELLRE
jgi:hypothetical protein